MEGWAHVAGIIRIDGIKWNNYPDDLVNEIRQMLNLDESLSEIDVFDIFNVSKVKNLDSLIHRILGKEVRFEELFANPDLFDDIKYHEDEYLPCGAEGTLEAVFIPEKDENVLNIGTISIFGDLRYRGSEEDMDNIINWFKKTCDKFYVRGAVISVNNGYDEKSYTYTED